MNERRVDRRFIGATIDILICKKVERKYRQSEKDSLSVIYGRALEDATRKVVLTKEDYRDIEDEIAANRLQRKKNRAQMLRDKAKRAKSKSKSKPKAKSK